MKIHTENLKYLLGRSTKDVTFNSQTTAYADTLLSHSDSYHLYILYHYSNRPKMKVKTLCNLKRSSSWIIKKTENRYLMLNY